MDIIVLSIMNALTNCPLVTQRQVKALRRSGPSSPPDADQNVPVIIVIWWFPWWVAGWSFFSLSKEYSASRRSRSRNYIAMSPIHAAHDSASDLPYSDSQCNVSVVTSHISSVVSELPKSYLKPSILGNAGHCFVQQYGYLFFSSTTHASQKSRSEP